MNMKKWEKLVEMESYGIDVHVAKNIKQYERDTN